MKILFYAKQLSEKSQRLLNNVISRLEKNNEIKDKLFYTINEIINLYLKNGFRIINKRAHYYDNNEDALIMWTENIFYDKFKTRYIENKLREEFGRETFTSVHIEPEKVNGEYK